MSVDITVFTRTNCPYCELMKKFLTLKSVTYKTVNIENDAAAYEQVMKLTGRAIAPTTLFTRQDGTQEVVTGYNLGRIASLL